MVAGTASIPSPESGGTAHILPSERNKATFDVFDLTTTIDGGVRSFVSPTLPFNEAPFFRLTRRSIGGGCGALQSIMTTLTTSSWTAPLSLRNTSLALWTCIDR